MVCLNPLGMFFLSFKFLLHAGHGGSDGLHAYVPSLDDAVNDMVQLFYFSCIE